MLGRWVGVGDDPASGLEVRDALREKQRPERDARVEADAGDVVADDAGVEARAGTPRAPR